MTADDEPVNVYRPNTPDRMADPDCFTSADLHAFIDEDSLTEAYLIWDGMQFWDYDQEETGYAEGR